MTRFKKGSIIEVLNNEEALYGSWWPAQIISGNGHSYLVRCHHCPCAADHIQRVPRKDIRPTPPPVENLRSWVVGDIVEVFVDCLWRPAEVLSVVGGNQFLVRVLGALIEVQVGISEIRVQKIWQDNNWVTILKDCVKFSDRMTTELLKEEVNIVYAEQTQLCIEENNCRGDGQQISIAKKRPRECFVGGCIPNKIDRRKIRKSRGNGNYDRVVAGSTQFLHKKVDTFVSPQKKSGANCIHASLNIRETGYSGTHQVEGVRITDDNPCYSDNESKSSSVGSCSASNSPYRSPRHKNGSMRNSDTCSDDSESYLPSDIDLFPSKQALEEKIHQLELNAYRSTMVALHASGPISWDQEEMMTNLRLTLHISNDEHLLELKRLISAEKHVDITNL